MPPWALRRTERCERIGRNEPAPCRATGHLKDSRLKILLVKLSSLGDVVHAMPAVQDICRALPEAQIDWVVEPAFAPLVRRCEGVSRVIECNLRQWRRAPLALATRRAFSAFRAELREVAYDRVIDLQGLTKSALVAWLAQLAPEGYRVALGNRTRGSSYEAPTRWVAHQAIYIPPRIHAVDRSRVLCAHALGYPPEGPERFGLQAEPAALSGGLPQPAGVGAELAQAPRLRGLVALVHGTSRDDKLWPEPLWVDLGRALMAQGFSIGLPQGSDAERERAGRIATALAQSQAQEPGQGTSPVAEVWPRLDLGALADRLAGCAGVVGVDSGLSHIATALDLPHVQIYNHDTGWRTGPVNRARQAPVFAKPHPPLDMVLAAWGRVSAA